MGQQSGSAPIELGAVKAKASGFVPDAKLQAIGPSVLENLKGEGFGCSSHKRFFLSLCSLNAALRRSLACISLSRAGSERG